MLFNITHSYLQTVSNFFVSLGLYVGIDYWEVDMTKLSCSVEFFSIYVGHHQYSNYAVALPSSAFSETAGSFLNCVGMLQSTIPAVLLKELSNTDRVLFELLCYLRSKTKTPYCGSVSIRYLVYSQHRRNKLPSSIVSTLLFMLPIFTRCTVVLNMCYVLPVRSNYFDAVSRGNGLSKATKQCHS